jgi:hypothetical protein
VTEGVLGLPLDVAGEGVLGLGELAFLVQRLPVLEGDGP